MLTNKYKLPEAIVRAVENDPYDPGDGDISVTQLISPPMIRHLRKKHKDEIVEDVSDRIWSLLGQAVHTILERATGHTEVAEKRLYMSVYDKRLSGQFDNLSLANGILTDYKVTSVYGANGKDEWTQQLNVLAILLQENGYTVKGLQIVGLFRDWRPSELKVKPDYPRSMVKAIPIKMWNARDAWLFINERLGLHFNDIRPCTDEERWYTGDTWAVKQKGKAKALRVLADPLDALAWCEKNGHATDVIEDGQPIGVKLNKGISIEYRPGVYKRCESYCNVSKFCPTWNNK